MTLEFATSLAEIVSALAVVVSLVYVGIEIRRNTRSNRAATSYQGAHSWAEMNSLAMGDPKLALLIRRSFREDEPSFEEADVAQLDFVGRSLMERLDGLFYLYKNKQLESDLWQIRITWTRRWLDRPFWREWWSREQMSSNYSQAFLEELRRMDPDGGPI